ncbi:MAG: polysaccharide biosynthesis/export family protein [Planctomycetes bacterium]|nr:polysaccharide biosynthesis/export family protein [Planctomycetota bacterium]
MARPRPNTEQIFVGDVLEVSIVTGLDRQAPNQWMLRVAEDGTINVPLVGPVRVDGMVLPHAEFAVRDTSVARGIYRSPQVSVRLADRRAIRVSVVGEVEEPGDYDVPVAQADLLAAISLAGGLKSETAGEIIEVTHPASLHAVQHTGYPGAPPGELNKRTITVNLRDVTEGRGGDFHLENGSVVMVKKRPPRKFSVVGLVKSPGQFEGLNEQDIRLLDAIAIAGGRTLEIADKVRIYRTIDGGDKPTVIQASVREAKGGGPANILLAPGDVVSVEETPLTFTVETIRSVIGFGFTAGIPGL